VAQTIRVSTAIALRPPMRSITRSCRKRSSLTCSGSGNVADLVEEQGAAVGQLDLALGGLDRAGERSLLVAEQFGFEQVFGDRGAVDGDEAAVLAAAGFVQAAWRAAPCRCRWRRAASPTRRCGDALDRACDANHLRRRGDQLPSTRLPSPARSRARGSPLDPCRFSARRTIRPSCRCRPASGRNHRHRARLRRARSRGPRGQWRR
jgi:hypothetical protein